MSKKLIFFDIDGTLVNHDKQLPDSAKAAVKQLKNEGHDVAIATGRAPFMFHNLMEELEIDTFVSLNGQYVEYKGNKVYGNSLSKHDLHQLTTMVASCGHPVIFEDRNGMKSTVKHHKYVEEAVGTLKLDKKEEFDPDYYKDHEIYQALLFCKEGEEENYQEMLQNVEIIRWHDYSVDVFPKGGSKANGIKQLVQYLGKSMEDVFAFGDGLNDIEMMKFVENSVAMGNAHEEVKKAAKYVTTHVDDEGLSNGLKLVGLL